jgi:hypothetical protein
VLVGEGPLRGAGPSSARAPRPVGAVGIASRSAGCLHAVACSREVAHG